MTHRIWIDPYTWTNDTVLEAHKRDESIAYIEGLYAPHYPVPAIPYEIDYDELNKLIWIWNTVRNTVKVYPRYK